MESMIRVTVEDEIRRKEREEKRNNDAEQKAKLIAEQVDGFVYPEKLPGLINYIKLFNLYMAADVLAKSIVSLGMGENFENITEELDKKIGLGSTRILVINALAQFAKNGPDFWLSDKKSRGEKIDNDDLEYADKFRKENIELEAKHNQQAPQEPGL